MTRPNFVFSVFFFCLRNSVCYLADAIVEKVPEIQGCGVLSGDFFRLLDFAHAVMFDFLCDGIWLCKQWVVSCLVGSAV